ncbi:MAG: hypothetical protein PHN82_04885 [bacterium]|nr:hypothetical protein [bacterium]
MATRPTGVGISLAAAFAIESLACAAAAGWSGAVAERIVSDAVAALPAEAGAFLSRTAPFFREGFGAPPETIRRYAGFERFDTTGHAAALLGGQVTLLRDLFPGERTPYMAYRMGVMARLVAEANSPFAADPSPGAERDRFMADIESRIDEVRTAAAPPRVWAVPEREIAAAVERAAGWAGPVKAQYRSGRGFNPVARAAAARFYGNAVHATSSALATVCGGATGASEAPARFGFQVDACGYALDRYLREDAVAAYRRAAEIAGSIPAERLASLEEMAAAYGGILAVAALEERLAAAGIAVGDPAGRRMRASFLTALSRLARGFMEAGRTAEARAVLGVCLREGYLPDWTLRNLGVLYRTDRLDNLDIPENAWKVYREANRFESVAGTALSAGRPWEAADAMLRAAALYAAIPREAGETERAARLRLGQVGRRLREMPPSALFSEELFQAAVDSLGRGDVEGAVRGFRLSRSWGGDERAALDALAGTEAYRLFQRGKALYDAGDHGRGVRHFRRITERFPASPFAAAAGEMVRMHDRMRDLEAARWLTLLKGAYEASFVGDTDRVYALCEEILDASPGPDMRDRAQLLIAVAWYEAGMRRYGRIDEVFRDLLRHRVLREDGGRLVLRKKIDFYFGLRDPFPAIEIEDLPEGMLDRLGLLAEAAPPDEAGEAEEAIERARDEIRDAEDLIERGEEAAPETMAEARSLLDAAVDLVEEAQGLFDDESYGPARERAEEAWERASEARYEAEEALGIEEEARGSVEELLEDARRAYEEAENAFNEAEDAAREAEIEEESLFDDLRSDYDPLEEMLREVEDLIERGEYEEARERAEELIEKADEIVQDADEVKEEAEREREEDEEGEEWEEE